MTSERWKQIKVIFEAALNQPAGERDLYVESVCQTDGELESEVKALLIANDSAADFLQEPAAALVGHLPPYRLPQTLVAAEIIVERFEIIRFLNSGGMGEVYEAWDRELQEQVALKTIRPEIASFSAVIAHFKREVKQARGISHPNICRVYDLFYHQQDSGQPVWFLTMELLRGQSLWERLRNDGPMSPREALELVQQMVAGLAAAHQLEMVHRDFKTGNVMLVDGGNGKTRAVITDFGLAFNLRAEAEGLSAPGAGTPDYMAPEQSGGGTVGFAADQFALGVVMCEMLTGHRPAWQGEKISLPAGRRIPPRWEVVIRRCLQVQPSNRFASITDVISALDPQLRRKKIRRWISTAALIALVAGGGVLIANSNSGDRIVGAKPLTAVTDLSTDPSLSRNGGEIAYISDRAGSGTSDLWMQNLTTGNSVRVATNVALDRILSISPDGTSVAFRSERNGGGIYLADASGGGERLLAAGGREPRFSPDGLQVLYWTGDADEAIASGQLFVVPVSGGLPSRLAANFKDARHGVWSADGQLVLFTGCLDADHPMPSCSEWWITNINGRRLQNTGALTLLRNNGISLKEDSIGGWYNGAVLFSGWLNSKTNLWELAISPSNLQATGPPRQLTYDDTDAVTPSLAADGTLAYGHLAGDLHIWRIDEALSAEALATKVTNGAGIDSSPYVSHNGNWLVFSRGFASHRNIYLKDLHSGAESAWQVSDFEQANPIIDDSGTTVVFESRQDNTPAIFTSVRGQPPKKLCSGCTKPTGWFDGGRAVLYREGVPSKIKMIDPNTGKSSILLESSTVSLSDANWSPENQYMLFTASTERGRNQVFAVRLQKSTGKTTGPWIPITDESEWSGRAVWSENGKAVFYVSTRDGNFCVWGRRFDPISGKATGPSFPVKHYHNLRMSPALVGWNSFGLSVSGDSIYLNPGEENQSIWVGTLQHRAGFSFRNWFR